MKRYFLIALCGLLFSLASGYNSTVFAFGECGLSCCISGAATSGVTLAEHIGLSLQYEYSHMENIKDGSSDISPDEVINNKWMMGVSYSVPTKMTMQKLSLIAAYPATERFQILGIIPYIKNDMDMRMKSSMGMTMNHRMDTVSGIGDITLMGFYTAYTDAPVRPSKRLTLGAGLKTPTGKNSERTSTGSLVHAMMQHGTGSWDPLFLVNYMRAYYPLILQANMFYHLTTEGDEGYEVGDQLSLDLIARYQAANYVNIGLELNGIHSAEDEDHDGKFSKPATSMVDNTDNTGLDSIFLTPGVQIKIPGTGGSADLKYQVPLYQKVNGIQQVTDWKVLTSITWNF